MNLREGVRVVNLSHASRLTAEAKDKSTQET